MRVEPKVIDFKEYGNAKINDKILSGIKTVCTVAEEAFNFIAAMCTIAAVFLFSATIATAITGVGFPVTFTPALIAGIITVAALCLTLPCKGGKWVASHYLNKNMPPIALATSLDIFRTPLLDMIRHASAPKEVIQKIEELRPEYEKLIQTLDFEKINQLADQVRAYARTVQTQNEIAEEAKTYAFRQNPARAMGIEPRELDRNDPWLSVLGSLGEAMQPRFL